MKTPRHRTTVKDATEGQVFTGFAQPQGNVPAAAPNRGNAPAGRQEGQRGQAPARMPGGPTAGFAATRAAVAARAARAMGPEGERYMRQLLASGLTPQRAEPMQPVVGQTDGAEPRTPENLPAVMSRAIVASGQAEIVPQWHMVRHLPGYFANAIRAMGERVFAPFTDTPIEEIQVVATLSNDEDEVKATMHWIRRNGIRDDQAELRFNEIMPGYAADVQIWRVEGYDFMMVKDFAGYYVYGWPGGRGVHLENDMDDVQLLPPAPRR